MKKLLVLATLVCSFVSAQAQMHTPVPPEMKKLNMMVGTWTGKMKANFMGQTMDLDCTSVYKMDLNGRYLVIDETMKGEGMNMMGHMMLTYDAKKSMWVGHWFDSEGPEAMPMSGKASNSNVITMTSEPFDMEEAGGKMMMRATWTIKDEKTCDFKLEMKSMKADAKWESMMEGTYHKKS